MSNPQWSKITVHEPALNPAIDEQWTATGNHFKPLNINKAISTLRPHLIFFVDIRIYAQKYLYAYHKIHFLRLKIFATLIVRRWIVNIGDWVLTGRGREPSDGRVASSDGSWYVGYGTGKIVKCQKCRENPDPGIEN